MWPQYGTDVHNFCIWCEQMEAKVCTMNGHNIETMLTKFEKVGNSLRLTLDLENKFNLNIIIYAFDI